jgi:calcineurin-like phosphoesterase family protein
MLFFTSDLHFGHVKIAHYCGRPYANVHEMNYDMTQKWNGVVSSNDDVVVNGDFSMEKRVHVYAARLNGRIILIRGNHDRPQYPSIFTHIYDDFTLDIGGFHCLLRHRPVLSPEVEDVYNDSPDSIEERERIYKEYDFIICGHVHEKWAVNKKNVNVGVDKWNFTPVSVRVLESFLECIHNRYDFMS